MNIMVAQSGGPTAVINSSLAGVIAGANKYMKGKEVFGALNGIEGVIKGNIVSLSEQVNSGTKLDFLSKTPAMALGSCRFKMPKPEKDKSVYEKIEETFKKYNIGTFVYIGGNDSMDTVLTLSEYFKDSDIKIVGVPKTIDNDLCGTDHTPGFGSAAIYNATTMSEIASDCAIYDLDAVTIVEIMGRNAGFLTMAAGIPAFLGEYAPHLIYLPERAVSKEKIVSDVKKALKTSKAVIIAVSEGVKTEDGEYLSASAPDAFGHKQLSGAGKVLEQIIKKEIGCKVRSIELNTPQRGAAHLMSETDRKEAYFLGEMAVGAAAMGKSGVVSVILREKGEDYEVSYSIESASVVANAEKKVPDEYINEEGNFITEEAFSYMLPLIMGETSLEYEDGIPKKFKIDKTKLV